MNFTVPPAMREATRLTGAGRLVEATAAIQRMAGVNATASASVEVGMTIDGTAERVGAPRPAPAPISRSGFLGKVSLKDLMRPNTRAASSSCNLAAPDGSHSDG